jgi:hypothetical protein
VFRHAPNMAGRRGEEQLRRGGGTPGRGDAEAAALGLAALGQLLAAQLLPKGQPPRLCHVTSVNHTTHEVTSWVYVRPWLL